MKLSRSRQEKGKLMKHLFFILIIVVLFTYVWPWAETLQFGATKTTLTIAFNGAGKGLDPQGNRFDINEIKSDEVLSKAIEASGIQTELTVDNLKKRVFILPRANQDTLKELVTLTTINGKTQDIKERMVYPTSFTIGLKDMELPSVFADRKLLSQIMKAYEEHLKSKYLSDTLSEPAYTKDEILKMDYPEMMKVLNQEAESLLLYVDTYANNEPEYVSETTGLSFADIHEHAQLLKDTDIGKMRSLVDYYGLTEDAQNRILYEETLLKRAGVVAGKMQGAQYTAADIVQIYDNNSNYIFASGNAGSVDLEPVENQFYGTLIDTLVKKQTSYINAKYGQEDIQRAIAKLKAGSLTGEAYLDLTREIKSGTEKVLVQMEALKKQTRDMAEEFYETDIGSKINTGGMTYDVHSNGDFIINYAVLAALWAVLSLLYKDLKSSRYNIYLEMILQPFRRKKNENRSEKV